MVKTVFISANTDAVDAAPITKEVALKAIAARDGVALDQVGAIGDSVNDLPFLTLPGLRLIGAPRNAQPPVRRHVESAPNGYLSEQDYLKGFVDFYGKCAALRLAAVFADRDGVLLWRKDAEEFHVLAGLFERMGHDGQPMIYVLTGSSVEQNLRVLHEPIIAQAFLRNERIKRDPRFVFAENGALAIDVLNGKNGTISPDVDPETAAILVGEFRVRLLKRVRASILPKFALDMSNSRDDQDGKIFMPGKKTMVTMNIPRASHGNSDFRRSPQAELLRAAIAAAMIDVAEELHVPYSVLGGDEASEPFRSSLSSA
ncbi:MAG TPA: hypothetical protein VMF53_07840 [Alphaproteobacteria bacterium]|nr:hypothetical protein [Alphaproteobacteria bacterium]